MNGNQLEQLLKFLTDTLQQGKDFTVDQAPQFVRELLAWQFYQAAIFTGLGVVIMLAGWIIAALIIRRVNKAKAEKRYSEIDGVQWLVGIVGTLAGVIILVVNIQAMIQVRVAPRVVIVEMVRSLISERR